MALHCLPPMVLHIMLTLTLSFINLVNFIFAVYHTVYLGLAKDYGQSQS